MDQNTAYPLIVRGPDKSIEIPQRMSSIPALQEATKTHRQLSIQKYTLDEIGDILEATDIKNISEVPHLHLLEEIQSGYTTLIQLLNRERWRIVCLLEYIEKGWSVFEQTPDGQVGIFHTGSRMLIGRMRAQYLVENNINTGVVNIEDLRRKQRQQPDIIAWRDKNF